MKLRGNNEANTFNARTGRYKINKRAGLRLMPSSAHLFVFHGKLPWNPDESLVNDVFLQLNVLHRAGLYLTWYGTKSIRTLTDLVLHQRMQLVPGPTIANHVFRLWNSPQKEINYWAVWG
ncbi:hypothetical protein CSKR_204002 [Clonorchis sinensis]|uniref:Uncharacterized protein n=1 Tax=Clonorchis sinensis TaxID=79923 RepID=A0A8T1MTI7_CLOSI|nr:hypothetical protein CSKR_204002 [Clonorchis sinensis]